MQAPFAGTLAYVLSALPMGLALGRHVLVMLVPDIKLNK